MKRIIIACPIFITEKTGCYNFTKKKNVSLATPFWKFPKICELPIVCPPVCLSLLTSQRFGWLPFH